PLAVGAPVALVGEALGIEHHDAPVAIAVRDIQLAVGDHHVRGPSKLRRAVGTLGLAGLAELLQELSIRCELEDLVVLVVVPRDPNVAVVVYEDAVFLYRPVVAGARAAPTAQQVAR